VVAAVARLMTMGGTRIFELGGKEKGIGAKESCCYRTYNGGKRAAGAFAVNDRK